MLKKEYILNDNYVSIISEAISAFLNNYLGYLSKQTVTTLK